MADAQKTPSKLSASSPLEDKLVFIQINNR